jgi:hypothetical protein
MQKPKNQKQVRSAAPSYCNVDHHVTPIEWLVAAPPPWNIIKPQVVAAPQGDLFGVGNFSPRSTRRKNEDVREANYSFSFIVSRCSEKRIGDWIPVAGKQR